MMKSEDGGRTYGTNATQMLLAADANAPSWYRGGCVWSPQCVFETERVVRVVFAGAPPPSPNFWWGDGTSIGVLELGI